MDESRIQTPILSGSRREKFAQEVAKGKSLSEAYRLVGYAPNPKNAQRLKSNESVKARIAELKARGAERAEVTIESLIDEAEEVRVAAIEDKQYSAAIAAIKEKGILSGKRVEKSEIAQKRALDELSYDELVRIAAGGSPPTDFDPTIN